jgi:hypothetical protein
MWHALSAFKQPHLSPLMLSVRSVSVPAWFAQALRQELRQLEADALRVEQAVLAHVQVKGREEARMQALRGLHCLAVIG